jgi:prevent-host-death family protein
MSAAAMRVLWQRGASLDNSHLDGYLAAMTDYTIAEAKNQLPKLIDRAIAGEEVVITRRGKPMVTLVSKCSPPAIGIDIEWLKSVQVKPLDPNFDVMEIIRKMRDEDPY